MKIGVSIGIALALHLLLGWQWSIAGALVAGAWTGKRGWLTGAGILALSWALLIAYNFIVAATPVQKMLDVMGGILGGLPGPVVILLTLLIGAVLGLIGGGLGAALAQLVRGQET